jgi:hypothetical protein
MLCYQLLRMPIQIVFYNLISMSVNSLQTNINQKNYFFLLANVSTLTADNIVAKSISTNTLEANIGEFSTIQTYNLSTGNIHADFIDVHSISSLNLEANYFENSTSAILFGNISSIVTNNITLDGNTIDTGGAGFGAVLLLNGLPIATGTSSFSSIQEWSYFPALSTLHMDMFNIEDAGNITCQNIYNALNVQTDTLNALTAITAPSATITNLRTTNFSTTNAVGSNINISQSANFNNISTGIISGQRGAFGGLSSLTLSTGTINGTPFISGSNWSQYPANSAVALAGNNIGTTGNLTISGSSNISITAPNNNLANNFALNLTGGDVNVTANSGLDPTNTANLNLTASGGTRGYIALTANAGVANTLYGQIDLTANGGNFGGIGTGGLININANTPIGLSNATSAVKINAAGINSYAGLIPSVGSLAGYNFIYGTNGVNICAGLPSLFPNWPFTTFIYGTNGVEIPSDIYALDIQPYWDGIAASNGDLNIHGRTINLTNKVYVNLSNVRNMDMEFFATINNVKGITFSNGYSNNFISNADTIQGSNTISGYTTISGTNLSGTNVSGTNGSFTTLSNTNIIGSGAGSITGYNNISSSNANLSSIQLSSINSFVSFGTKSMRLDGDVAQIQLSNDNIAGQGTILNLLSRITQSEIQSFNSNFTTPLPLFLNASYTSTPSIFTSTINGQRLPYPYGSFTANTSQTLGVANTALSTIMDTTERAVGISIVGGTGTRVAVSTSGVYRWLASPQFDTTSGGQNDVSFWFQQNGTAIPRSASRQTIQNNGEIFTSVEVITYMDAFDYIETCFTSADTNMNLAYYAATGVIPAVPSLILNGQKIAES